MKHLHYGTLVLSIGDQLATTIENAAIAFMNEGRNAVWPISCYRDEREEVSVQLAFGPGIPFAITETWLTDDRPNPRHTDDSIGYIEAELDVLENESPDE